METEEEKMLEGVIYNCADPKLIAQWHEAKKIVRKYNAANTKSPRRLEKLLTSLLGHKGQGVWIAQPFFCDYGKYISIGDNTELNCNCVILDCNHVTIGCNVLIGPAVQIYAASHPVRWSDRLPDAGEHFCKNQSKPVTIGDNVWVGGGSVILPGVTIGDNTTIGAGSVVVHSIPSGVLAAGNPCRVIREL